MNRSFSNSPGGTPNAFSNLNPQDSVENPNDTNSNDDSLVNSTEINHGEGSTEVEKNDEGHGMPEALDSGENPQNPDGPPNANPVEGHGMPEALASGEGASEKKKRMRPDTMAEAARAIQIYEEFGGHITPLEIALRIARETDDKNPEGQMTTAKVASMEKRINKVLFTAVARGKIKPSTLAYETCWFCSVGKVAGGRHGFERDTPVRLENGRDGGPGSITITRLEF